MAPINKWTTKKQKCNGDGVRSTQQLTPSPPNLGPSPASPGSLPPRIAPSPQAGGIGVRVHSSCLATHLFILNIQVHIIVKT